MEDKDKINFDLNFLDENTKEKPKHKAEKKPDSSPSPRGCSRRPRAAGG